MPFCIHCGREVSEDAQLCPYCGKSPRIVPAPVEKRAASQISGREIAGLVFGATGIAIVIAAGVSMVSNAYYASAGSFYRDLGFGFVGLGLFLTGILFIVLGRSSRS
jgi:uncharacterized membrane protein YvbJ